MIILHLYKNILSFAYVLMILVNIIKKDGKIVSNCSMMGSMFAKLIGGEVKVTCYIRNNEKSLKEENNNLFSFTALAKSI